MRDVCAATRDGFGFSIQSNMAHCTLDVCTRGYPGVPNPTNPAEDYADKWRKNPLLERNFQLWNAQVQQDLAKLHTLSHEGMDRETRERFSVQLTRDQLRFCNN
jgi:hypothetical protein